jgi:hypothetical protein
MLTSSKKITIEINFTLEEYQNIDGTITVSCPIDSVFLGDGEGVKLSDVGRVKLAAAVRELMEQK